MDELIFVPLTCHLPAWLTASCARGAHGVLGTSRSTPAALEGGAGDTLAVSHCPNLTYGGLQGPLSFGGSFGLNGNKVIFNAAVYRGSLGGLLSPEMHVFRVACGPHRRGARLTRQQPSLECAAR